MQLKYKKEFLKASMFWKTRVPRRLQDRSAIYSKWLAIWIPGKIDDVLNEQFRCVFISVLENMKIHNPIDFCNVPSLHRTKNTIIYINITEEDVILTIDELKSNSVSGSDKF